MASRAHQSTVATERPRRGRKSRVTKLHLHHRVPARSQAIAATTGDRRGHSRKAISLECTLAGCGPAFRISDLSLGGCYVDSPYLPSIGARTEVNFTLEGVPANIQSKVVNVHQGIGFGLEFIDLDEATLERIRAFVTESDEAEEDTHVRHLAV